jgi:hypothetical protein
MSVLPMIVSSQLGKEVECKSHLDCFTLLAMTNLTVSNRGGEVGSGGGGGAAPPPQTTPPLYFIAMSLRAQRNNLLSKLNLI